MNTAPAIAAIVPTNVTPPEVPGGTLLPRRDGDRLTAERAFRFLSPRCPPRMLPTRRSRSRTRAGRGMTRDPSAARAYTPSVGQHLPRVSLAALLDHRPRQPRPSLPAQASTARWTETKKEISRSPQLQPAAMAIVPTTAAATAPLRRERARTMRKECDGDSEQTTGDCSDERFSQL